MSEGLGRALYLFRWHKAQGKRLHPMFQESRRPFRWLTTKLSSFKVVERRVLVPSEEMGLIDTRVHLSSSLRSFLLIYLVSHRGYDHAGIPSRPCNILFISGRITTGSFVILSHSFHKHPGGILTRPGDYFIAFPKRLFSPGLSNDLWPDSIDSIKGDVKGS
jgi:hypothetical protein